MKSSPGLPEAANKLISDLKERSNLSNIEGMGRYGIKVDDALGISMPEIRSMAKQIGKNHELAQLMWESKIHEARILAGLIDEPKLVTYEQMESWVVDFDSWDVCDQVCSNLFDKTAYAYRAAREWSKRDEVFVKRAGFVMMAALAVHDKKAGNEPFLEFLKIIKAGSADDRNFVKKSVNWALRQIGKRNLVLNRAAIETAIEIDESGPSSAHWIAKDALRELKGETIQKKLAIKASSSRSSDKENS